MSAPGSSLRLIIDEQTQIGAARRAAAAMANAHGLGADAVGRLAIVVTEAATNILHHAGSGTVILRALFVGAVPAVEVLALDKGPGIRDVTRAMGDGYSTLGTAGQGLGGMRRLADAFEIYSHRDMGTVLMARVHDITRAAIRLVAQPPSRSMSDRIGIVCVALLGQVESGDAWQVVADKGRVSVMVVDGLGHGSGAAVAAGAAMAHFPALAGKSPEATLTALDRAMRGTRGAAMSVAVIDEAAGTVRFSGVGNVDGRVLGGSQEHLVPQNGIVGHTMPTVRAVDGSWPAGARLIMHSDGISARWRMEAYPGLMAAHPAIIAGVLFRDFARERDDATVFVLADQPWSGGAR